MEDNKTLTTTMDVLKKETKEKEDKYIEEIVYLEKKKKDLDNIIYKLGHFVQTMHTFTKPQVFYDKNYKIALGYKNPFYLRKAQRIQPVFSAEKDRHDNQQLKKHIANLKGKAVADCSDSVNNSRVIAPRVYKLDLQPFSYTLRKNKEVHEDYLEITKEHVDTLHGIVEQARALEPSDKVLDYANVIAAGADNRPPMLEKSMYESWQSRMKLNIRGKEHGKDLLDSVVHGPFQYGTVEENGITRPRTYEELTDKEKIQSSYLIMKGTELSLQERECKLYNEFDRFTSEKGETIHAYYLRFAQLINDMNTIGMTMQKLQVNTNFVNNLQPEWSNMRSMPMKSQPYHVPVIHSPPVVPQQAYQVPTVQQQPQAVFPQLDSGLVVSSFLP
nr:hypothetical protein [Tanacetum cinerariifolium]